MTRDLVLGAIRRWSVVVIAAGVISGAAALVVSSLIPPTYRATAQLLVSPTANPTVALQDVVSGQNVTRSYVQLATAEVVLRPAMNSVGWTDLKSFRERTTVTQARETFVMNISFDSTDAEEAARTTNAIAQSFLAQTRALQSSLQSTVLLWQPATTPTEPETPRVALNTVLGAIFGAVVAATGLGLWRYLNDHLTEPEHVSRKLGVLSIGEVQRGRQPETLAGKLFVRDEPGSREAESFRSLRTNITFAAIDRRPRTLLVTSALPQEGKSVIGANLALAFAQAGSPTVLIDADLRRPSQHSLFRVSSAAGLTTLLSGDVPLTSLQRFRVAPNLLVIPAGPPPPNPAELLSSARMSALLKELSSLAEASTVIADTSPVLPVADATALSTKFEGTLLVVDAGRTATRAVRHAVDRLRQVRATILGVVLNKVAARDTYYGYGYQIVQEAGPEPAREAHGSEA